MRPIINLASFLCLLSTASSQTVMAADMSVRGFFSQRVEADSNPDLESADFSNPALYSVTDLGVAITLNTPRTTLSFAPGVNFTLQSDESADITNINPRFNSSFARRGNRISLGGGFSVIPQLTNNASSQFDSFSFTSPDIATPPDASDGETSPAPPPEPSDGSDGQFIQDSTNSTALELNVRANLNLSYAVDPRNSISSGVTAQARRFSGDNNTFTDSETYGINLGWNHRLDPRTSISVTNGYRLFSSDGNDENSNTYDISFGFNRNITQMINASADIGTSLSSNSDGDSINFIGGAGLSYRGKEGSISAGVRQSVDQNEFGDLENRTSVFISPSYRINSLSSFSMPIQAAFTNPVFSNGTGSANNDEVTLTIGPSLSYALNADWRINTGYRLRFNNEDSNIETSNFVFLQLSRNFNLLP